MVLYARKVLKRIIPFLERKNIIVLHGARQVGKTSIMQYLIQHHLITDQNTPPNQILYFDLEDFTLLDLCNSGADKVMQYLEENQPNLNKKIYLFIDEIQYLDNPSNFLKLFHDRYGEKVKLIVSGSSSFEIKSKFKDSLVGRTIDFEIFGLDFEEFLQFKNVKINTSSSLPITIEKLKSYFQEYTLYGGYPAIALEKQKVVKQMLLKQIINTYIKKDIRDLANVKQINKFNGLIRVLASQSGNLVNISELSNTVKIAQQTVEDYLFLLENTYIIRRVYPFHSNLRSELSKMPKIYFEDTGLQNLLAHNDILSTITGQLLENSVYSELRKNYDLESLYFWRTNKGQEIDFILKKEKLIPIEVKLSFLNKKITNLKYFQQKYEVKKSYVCTINQINEGTSNTSLIYPWQIAAKFSKFKTN